MGKWSKYEHKFNIEWSKDPQFSMWVDQMASDQTKAVCKYCKVSLRAHKADLRRHMKCLKHRVKISEVSSYPSFTSNAFSSSNNTEQGTASAHGSLSRTSRRRVQGRCNKTRLISENDRKCRRCTSPSLCLTESVRKIPGKISIVCHSRNKVSHSRNKVMQDFSSEGLHKTKHGKAEEIRVGILTISDRCFHKLSVDESGPGIAEFLRKCQHFSSKVVISKCCPDDKMSIINILRQWADDSTVDLAITTGGTGVAPTDVTPEAVREIIEKEVPGIGVKMLLDSLKVTDFAMLSRPLCGIRKRTIIITLPGSPKAAVECLSFVAPALLHAVDLITEAKGRVAHTHLIDQSEREMVTNEEVTSKVDVSRIARRDRKSPYPIISVDEAQNKILSNSFTCSPIQKKLLDSLGFSLTENIYAFEALPPFAASVKDGYAIRASDGTGVRRVIGQSCAGTDLTLPKVTRGTCIRINTGAPIPPGADAVVQVEDTELLMESDDGREEIKINILKAPSDGQEIRKMGSDIGIGQQLFKAGTVVGPAEIGVMASAGVHDVSVYNKPIVAVLSTGNELQGLETFPLKDGHIYDCNKAALLSVLRQSSVPYVDAGIAKDDASSLLRSIQNALLQADILVTTGGVSMGDKDLLRPVLTMDLGARIHFAQVFMKPGKPTTFATCQFRGKPKLILGLPGNPVSAIVTAHLYLMPLFRKMSGYHGFLNKVIKCKISSQLTLDSRPEYHRATLTWSPSEPIPLAVSTGKQISSRLLSLSAEALLRLPPSSKEKQTLSEGSVVDAVLLHF